MVEKSNCGLIGVIVEIQRQKDLTWETHRDNMRKHDD